MSQWLISIVAFIVAIGILVSIHEYGHFWVARRLGVRVLRYSIGFGHKLIGWTSKRTGIEYWIAMLPLGGYVKMLDEREAPVPVSERHQAFNRVHPWRRIAIVAAGPGVNILFAILAYWLMFLLGMPGIKPILDAPAPDTPAAQAQVRAQDEVLAINGEPVDSWHNLNLDLIAHAQDAEPVRLTVKDPQGRKRQLTLSMDQAAGNPEQLLALLGLRPYQPPATPYLGEIQPDSPAAHAGLKSGDGVLAVAGTPVKSPQALVNAVRTRPDESVVFRVRRDGVDHDVRVRLGESTQPGGSAIGHLGAVITVDPADLESMRTDRRLGPVAAVPAAVEQTWQLSVLSVRLIGRMLLGQVSWHDIGGPVQIANYAGQTMQVGLIPFISFLAFISINLALINLLPIPVLDGGHILYYAIEWIRGRPLSEGIQVLGQQLGMVALLLLMTLAFYNDIMRLLG